MSNALAIITGDIYGARDAFESVLADRSINFDREAEFAIQVLQQNDYALKLATGNRQSVINAVTNVAAIGISLNPAKKQAYLVPRDGKICLDISYMGLIDLATATGSIKWAKAAVVHANDSFVLNGFDKPPEHQFNPFGKDRGEPIGVYVVVKTADGDYLTEAMSASDVNAIRDRSSAWKAWVSKQKSCPWVTDWSEMAKKTVIKRAYKTWPKTDRLDEAIHHLNTDGDEGLYEINNRSAAPAAVADKPSFDRTAWIEKANKAQTVEDLATVWRTGTEAAAKAKDRDGYSAFKDVVNARKSFLEAKANATDVEAMEGGAQ
jgi:recombination protein RecT